jgi:anti-sigma factor RsiW
MLDLTCRDAAEFLMAYLDHEGDETQRTAFDQHLGEYDECVLDLRRYEETVRLGQAAFHDPAASARAILAGRK